MRAALSSGQVYEARVYDSLIALPLATGCALRKARMKHFTVVELSVALGSKSLSSSTLHPLH
jgi:hypothetical protein